MYDRGSLWVGGSSLIRLKDDRIVQRPRSWVSRMGVVRSDDRLWVTGGGDGGVPDGSVLAFDLDSSDRVERLEFAGRSPNGIDAGGKGIFVALFQGDLLRISPQGDVVSNVPLKEGLTQVLVAHGKVWVSSPQRGLVWGVEFHGRDDTGAMATELRSEVKRSCPQGLASTSTAIWVADPCAHMVWILDPRSGGVVDRVDGLGRPIDIAITRGSAWILSFRDNRVTVLDVKTLALVAEGQGGEGAAAIAAHGRDAWVANHEDYSLTHFELP